MRRDHPGRRKRLPVPAAGSGAAGGAAALPQPRSSLKIRPGEAENGPATPPASAAQAVAIRKYDKAYVVL